MRKNSKSKLIIFLFFALIFMGIGYATLQSNLSISGTTQAVGNFDIEITSVSETNGSISSGGVTFKTETHTTKSATFNAEFTKPGDYVEYYVKVENLGTIDGIISTSISSNGVQKDNSGRNIYLFEVIEKNTEENYINKNAILEAGDYKELLVKISFNPEAESMPTGSVSFTFDITSIQKGKYVIDVDGNIEDPSWDFKVDQNGTITAYNTANPNVLQNGYIVVGATNYEGKSITGIDRYSFLPDSNIYLFMQNGNEMAMYIDYPRDSNEYNTLKTFLKLLEIEEQSEVEGTRTQIENITPNKISNTINSKIERIDTTYLKFYGKGEIAKPEEDIYGKLFVDPLTGYAISSSPVAKLNLANASNLTTIEDESFRSGDLNEIIFSQNGSLTTIGKSAFKGSKLTSVTIPRTVTSIGEEAFSGCLLNTLMFENGSLLTSIQNRVFYENQLRGTVAIPSGVTSIGNYAFYGSNNNITTLTIPNSVTTIGSNVFQNATIQSLTIDMTTIPSSTFNSKGIQTLTVGNHTQTISSSAFYNDQISTLNLGNATSLQTIGNNAFQYNQISGTLTIPNSVTSIGNYAFSGSNNNITTLTIPNSVTTIGSNVFENATIQSLTIDMTTIPSNSFELKGIQTLTLGNHVQTIGYAAFAWNQISGTLTIPSSVTTIGGLAFNENQISGTLTIPSRVTSIGESAFRVNQISTLNLTNATSLQTIGSTAFEDNQIGGSLEIPSSVTSIGYAAFCGTNDGLANNISELIFESGSHLQTIGNNAFQYNQISGSLEIPSSVTSIGDYAFKGDNIFTTLTIPNNVTTMGIEVFNGSTIDLLSIDMTNIPGQIFNSSSGEINTTIKTLILGNHVQTIENSFLNCQIEGTITLPDSVTTVGSGAFENNKIEVLNIGSGLTLWYSGASFGNDNLTAINVNMTESEWRNNVYFTGNGYGTISWQSGTACNYIQCELLNFKSE